MTRSGQFLTIHPLLDHTPFCVKKYPCERFPITVNDFSHFYGTKCLEKLDKNINWMLVGRHTWHFRIISIFMHIKHQQTHILDCSFNQQSLRMYQVGELDIIETNTDYKQTLDIIDTNSHSGENGKV